MRAIFAESADEITVHTEQTVSIFWISQAFKMAVEREAATMLFSILLPITEDMVNGHELIKVFTTAHTFSTISFDNPEPNFLCVVTFNERLTFLFLKFWFREWEKGTFDSLEEEAFIFDVAVRNFTHEPLKLPRC